METEIISILRNLSAAGPDGFEGLIARLLNSLTGQYFRLAKSGSQAGRDISSREFNANVLAVECKRYKQTTELDERELLGELTQVVGSIPDLDLWILVASRNVDSQLYEALYDAANRYGIEFLTISDGDVNPSSLEILCAQDIDTVLTHLKSTTDTEKQQIQAALLEIVKSPNFNETLVSLKEKFLSPLVGYDNWHTAQNKRFRDCLKSETESRAHFGQTINFEEANVNLVKRESAWEQLDKWLNEWGEISAPYLLSGEEGDGKTWCIASWLSSKIQLNDEFPAVLFLTSHEISSKDPYLLLSQFLYQEERSRSLEYWQKRIERWMSGTREQFSVFLLVLDGINECHNIAYWRSLLEKLQGDPWSKRIKILITCRTAYWERHQNSLQHLKITDNLLSPYTDNELRTALEFHNLSLSNIPNDLLDLIRKPRYVDLMIKYREQISQSGDVTIVRLIYEDWKDRLYRKRSLTDLNNETFQDFLRDLASKYQVQKTPLREQEIDSLLPSDIDKQTIIRELCTGGILSGKGNRYEVNEQQLIYGFGLLLVDQLKQAENNNLPPEEILAQWLEPQADMDIKARICEFASLYALEQPILSTDSKVALLLIWVNNHNATINTGESFIAYLPCDPESYIQLAEIVWADSTENRRAQNMLMGAFMHWRELPSFISNLTGAFEHWLGFVHLYGFLNQRGGSEKKAENVREKICSRVGLELKPGQSFKFAGFSFNVINDDGLLRLGRVALAIISHLHRGAFVRALVIGCLAEAIMDYADKYELFQWVMLTSKQSVWGEVKRVIQFLIDKNNEIAYQAAHRLLSFEGSEQAYQLQITLPQDLFSYPAWFEGYQKDSCAPWFAWDVQKCELCIQREELEPDFIARKIKPHCVNPDLHIPDAFGDRLSSLVESMSIELIWSLMGPTKADISFESYEPALCAYAPNAIADFVQSVVHRINQRQGLALRQISFRLLEHYLIFSSTEQDCIYGTWKQLNEDIGVWEEPHKTAEQFLFKTVLKSLPSRQQLKHLLKRRDDAPDLIVYEKSFLPITNWDVVWQVFKDTPNDKAIQRVLWFMSKNPENILINIITDLLLPLMENENSLIRSLILQILYFAEDNSVAEVVVNGTWAWNANYSEQENHWGSLLLSKYGASLPYVELRSRIHPTYLGYAIRCRGTQSEEVNRYAEDIDYMWEHLGKSIPDLPDNFPNVEIYTNSNNITEYSLKDISPSAFSQITTFFTNQACWGGDRTPDILAWYKHLTADNGELHQSLQALAQQAIKQQIETGNFWFSRHFYTDTLVQVAEYNPNLVNKWVNAISHQKADALRLLHLGHSFYEALCQVLLYKGDEKGVDLYWRLQESHGIRVVDKKTKIWSLDYALFKSPHTEQIEQAWQQRLESCTSDRELLEVAILAQWGNGMSWLRAYINNGINSSAPLNKAMSTTLLGLLDSEEAFEYINSILENAPDTWIKQILEISTHRWQLNAWAKHWYQRFLNIDDAIQAWAAFRLLLQCIDTRFWFWYKDLKLNAMLHNDRLAFLEENENLLTERIKKNEENLKRHFLTQKILSNQVWPWI
ncbi:MAG: NACHT domain-containing protein [Anaerolineae bacterium]|nr:NACHT domain-containing protein [Anaerolineae bacterium]